MLTTIRALCGSQNMPTTSLPSPCSPSQTHSLPIIPRLFARGFPLCLFYLCSHSMTPVPPVSCCLTYTPPHRQTHTASHPPFCFPKRYTYPINASARSEKPFSLFLFPTLCREIYRRLPNHSRRFFKKPYIDQVLLKSSRYVWGYLQKFSSFNYSQGNRISDFFIFSDQIHVFWEGEISWPIKAIINCIGGKRPLQLRPSLSKGVCFPLNNAVCSILKISSLTFFSLSLTLFFFYSYKRSLNAFSDLQV